MDPILLTLHRWFTLLADVDFFSPFLSTTFPSSDNVKHENGMYFQIKSLAYMYFII